ncbi:MAG: peptidoglycan DD-metalloendopeptidase family protein [Rhizobiaceae bacterium]|nr:peptidoglycan DD-metalloendopeptidase family protein [Rhizobiaceae bacterium]
MRVQTLRSSRRNLARGAAILMIGGLASGCSSDAVRFSDGVDGLFTSSTAKRQTVVAPPTDQAFPGDTGVQASSLDGTYTGSVNRTAVEPATGGVTRTGLAPVGTGGTTEAPSLATATLPASAPAVDRTVTGTVADTAPAKPVVQELPAAADEGWSRAGGTQVTIKEGETVYNLSRRFGVPPKEIMKANGLTSASALKAGQKVVIPTYVYSRTAPTSMPDADPNVAVAKSSTGTKYDVPADKVPLPTKPTDKVAVLPSAPKVKEPEVAPAATESAKADNAAKPAGTYTVAAGDTLSKIAKKTGVGVPALKEANGLSDGLLRIGQVLKVPGGKAATVAAAEPAEVDKTTTGAAGPAKSASSEEVAGGYTPPKKDAISEVSTDTAAAAPDATGIGRMRWPVRGRVISNYGKGGGKSNDGIDIAVPEGTIVKAAENGVVIYAGDGLKDFGNTVLVRHEDGLVTVYGHTSELKVSRGDKVKRGQEIARSGMSGNAEMPKLHFEVRKDSAPVDPSSYLE